MTISGPAVIVFAFFLAAAERQGVAWERARRDAADRHPEGVHRAEGVALPAATAPAADRRPHGVLRRARPEVPSDQRVAATTSERPGRRRRRSLRSRSPTGSPTWSSVSSAGSMSTGSPRACRSSSTPTSTSSRRSRSTGRRGGSGRGGCGSATARRTKPMRLRFHTQTAGVSLTAQQPMNNVVAHRRSRRSPRCSAARSRCTRTRSTRCWRSRPRRRRSSRSAPSRSSRTRPGVADVIDPLGGSYFVESLTDRMEELAEEEFARIEAMGERLDARRRARGDRARLVPAGDRGVRLPRAGAVRVRRPRQGRGHDLRGASTRRRSTPS